MFVGRFGGGVKVSDDFAIILKIGDVDIEKGYGCEGKIACEFYGGVNVIKKVNVLKSCTDSVHIMKMSSM